MLTALKNLFRRHKIVQLSNGKWIVFVRLPFGWAGLDKNTPRAHQWRSISLIKDYCLCNSEEEAANTYAEYSKGNITDEIKAHL